ncbi:chemotaxis-specific protein-glutamate methyltransferase CheB [Falsiroseomonas sp. HW251]|uniref:chemotaxis-specific protein-glutamate methyltransferase CheB n=1 Tax=Falsiroseomonas sp. HW251 TaxID=3390998 RepID=UPI003D314207
MIRVLVVDDSTFMRLAMRRIIEAEGDLRVVGEAADGEAAIEQAARLRPDVVAMDIEMPRLDGIEATRRIMALPDPPAVLVVSHHTRDGSATALAALERGAVDYVCKDSDIGGVDLGMLDKELRLRLRHWAGQRSARRPIAITPAPVRAANVGGGCDLVVIGASTGGPDALALLLAAAGPLPVPCVIAQHMPADLAPDLAAHLARLGSVPVVVGEAGQVLLPGEVVLIPGGCDGQVARRADAPGLALRLRVSATPVQPSVDLLFRSAATAARRALGVVMTGMGRDGELGAQAMTERGMPVLAQSPESCVVAGMPGALIEAGLAAETHDPAAMGRRIARLATEKPQ